MQIQPFSFKEFGEEATGKVSRARPFLPAGSTKEGVPPPPPPPVYKEEDLKAAERDGYKKGFLAGEQEGKAQAESEQASVNRTLSETVEKFAEAVSPVFADYRAFCLETRNTMSATALAIARKVAGSSLQDNAQKVIEDMVLHCCEVMMHEPKLSIAVHPDLGDTLARKLEELGSRVQSASDIIVLHDPDMPLHDCRIEWKHGAVARDTAQLWQQIEKVVGNMTLCDQRDINAHLDTLESPAPDAQAEEQPKPKE